MSTAGASTLAEGIDPVELVRQARRIEDSPGFAQSEILRNLLIFLAKAAAERPGENVGEQDIAAHVLDRRDFDGRSDSAVRVHMGRLRAKLAEYYVGPGAEDLVLLTVPKGSYVLQAARRAGSAAASALPDNIAATPILPVAAPPSRRGLFLSIPALAAAGLLLAAALVGVFVSARQPASSGLPQELRRFWQPFTATEQTPLVIFGSPVRRGPELVPDSAVAGDVYPSAGAGAVVAIHELTGVFTKLNRGLHLKHSSQVTWDDARRQPLILVGGPYSNDAHAVLPQLRRFHFRGGEAQNAPAFIEDLRPQTNQPNRYMSQTQGAWERTDYSIVALVPTHADRQPALILAGLTTIGTQAAGEFINDLSALSRLYAQLDEQKNAQPYFEALLRVRIHRGAPIRSDLVAVYAWPPETERQAAPQKP